MNRLLKRTWFTVLIALALQACTTAPVTTTPKHFKPLVYRPFIRPQMESAQGAASAAYPDPYAVRTPDHYASQYSGVFQKPSEMEPAVDFWRKTYAIWSRSEVAFHDDRYMDVIYEVMQLPGYVSEGLTEEQKAMISERRNFWKTQLAFLESKLRYNAPLNAGDRQLLAKLQSGGKQFNNLVYGASERVRSQRGTRERFKRGLEISGRYDPQFRKIFRDAGLPEDLAYLPHVESSFQVSARSSAGAVGMWQFTKAAARTFMPGNGRVDLRHDPIASAQGAAHYLSYAYGKLGDWPCAITSYNHGIGGMMRAQNQVGHDFTRIVQSYSGPLFGYASRNYYAQFLAAREIANNPMMYFPEGVQYETPPGAGQYLAKE